MEIRFRTRHLERCYLSLPLGERAWGKVVSRRYQTVVRLLQDAPSVQRLREVGFLRFHALTGEREGQYALRLHGRWRLVVSFEHLTAIIEEVSNHYGD